MRLVSASGLWLITSPKKRDRGVCQVHFYIPAIEAPPVPPGHRFPASKYRLLRELVLAERILPDGALRPSPLATRADLLLAHDAHYVDAILSGTIGPDAMRRIGLPWNEALAERSRATVGGAMAAARAALATGLSGQLAGGTHHAHRGFGSGFCVFNDLAVAALSLLAEGRISRLAILDLDVHQGDGNSAILKDVPGVLIVSIQGARNFPFRRVASHVDVDLADGTGDAAYLATLADVLPALDAHRPELLLYLSGADALREDRLGRLALTHEGLAERDRMVFEYCRLRGLPVSIAIGGGYADPIELSVRGYANTFKTALEVLG